MVPLILGILLSMRCASQEEDRLVATIPEDVRASILGFSEDGKVAVYFAAKAEQLWCVAGDWKSKPSRFPSLAVLLGNGKDHLFVALGRETAIVYLNDKVLFETPSIREWAWRHPGAVSPDGSVVVNEVRNLKSGKSGVALNGKIQELHDGTASSPVLSRDGKVFAFALEKSDGHCIVVDARPGPLYDWVTQPALSADGKIVAYGMEEGEKGFVIHGDRKLPAKSVPKGVFMSADGKSIGYWAVLQKGAGLRVVVGDREGPEFAFISPPVFSPDGKHTAYRAKAADGTWSLCIDERRVEAKGIEADPVFMNDGKSVGYGYRKGMELRWKTLDVN